MDWQNDPNPLPHDYPCGMKWCIGTVWLDDDGIYRCDNPICDYEMPYEEMKGIDLFVRHSEDQLNLTPQEMLEALEDDEADDEEDEGQDDQ